jgi:hypothetical protein
MKKLLLVLFLAAIGAGAGRMPDLPAAEQAALDRISADSMKVRLTYLASSDLQGRGTPSRGLDLAADYIAEQFRRAGLEPAAPGGSYFQTAPFAKVTPREEGFALTIRSGERSVTVPVGQTNLQSDKALDAKDAPVLLLPANGAIPPVAGRVVAGDEERYGDEALLADLASRKPALILLFGRSRFIRHSSPWLEDTSSSHPPVLRIRDSAAAALLRNGDSPALTIHAAEPSLESFQVRNVAGLLPGSDPVLRNQYVLVTAHYDHLGSSAKGFFPGANDDGSGTVSVMEIAGALGAMNPRPRRSILFMTFFGEEEGLLGSYYYAEHPLEPLRDTVADINLEQMGRTDDPAGTNKNGILMSGVSYSDLAATLGEAAKWEGVTLRKRTDSDEFFDRSDNYAFALHGIVAHTLAVAFDFPDYHRPGDTADRIDYQNMARVDRAVAAGLISVSDRTEPPAWSDSKAAGMYREAAAR